MEMCTNIAYLDMDLVEFILRDTAMAATGYWPDDEINNFDFDQELSEGTTDISPTQVANLPNQLDTTADEGGSEMTTAEGLECRSSFHRSSFFSLLKVQH